ncbi:hypothetical protein [Nocardioides sediminis]|uniref:hypothetical protein n=1 Tax=Nocardioides sediminis TaxID=433648 RepID=UPI00131F1739|nr:hypothetical protein [Nocardioides sediminis]
MSSVVSAVVLLTGCGATGDQSSAPSPPPGLESGCPDPGTAPPFPDGDLPRGATRVRACPGPTSVTGDDEAVLAATVQPPRDLLTTDVDRLVGVVNDQEDAGSDLSCTANSGPEVVYWFGYAQDEWRAVQHGSYGCHLLTTGADDQRLGGEALAREFAAALLDQRREAAAPATTARAICRAPNPTPRTALAAADLDVVSARRCVMTRPGTVRSAVLTPDLLARVNADLWPGVDERSRRLCASGSTEWIEGVTAWGDVVAWAVDACGGLHPLHGASVLDGGRHYLAPDLDAALAALPLGPSVQQW